jgi:phosphocarrier protein
MVEFNYEIKDESGVHARPAGRLVKKAQSYECAITIAKGGKTASLKKLFALMGLAVKCGETVSLRFEGVDEAEAASGIKSAMEAEGL